MEGDFEDAHKILPNPPFKKEGIKAHNDKKVNCATV
jgi:hypothetical protein